MPPFIRRMRVHEGTDDEISFGYFSIGLRVGPKALNDNWDVMLVQAMLVFLWPSERGTPDHLCPHVTGVYDKPTARAIHNYQLRHRLEADWYIDPLPPGYHSVIIGRHRRTLFTMASLYIHVMEKAVFEPLRINPEFEVLMHLVRRFPDLGIVASYMREDAAAAGVY